MQGQSLASSQQIILALRNARQQIEELEKRQREPIAIIGMGCRFPGGADSPDQFWALLRDGVDGVSELPLHHHDPATHPSTNPQAPKVVGGFLQQVDRFDPQFFGIAPREAAFIDPQQRLLLEVCWEAMEAAHIVPETLFDSDTGIFVGLCQTDYAKLALEPGVIEAEDLFHANVGTIMSTAAGRLSYTFGFTGPAVVVDTACSSSLVAIHQACQSLRNGECTVALAGGVNLILLTDWASYPNADAEQQYIYAADGRCKTFDAAADGFGRGEGCGMIVLKRLSDAEADGDTILAVIRGSMVNQDGRSSGLTAPSGPAQQKVIRHALQNAGIEPVEVSYIEAHGTGTILGDPIEIGALNAVFGKRTEPLWVSSVKTNLGHLEGAAGVAGLIKIVLSFQHRQLPPHLNLQQPNPLIDWARSPVRVPRKLEAWTVNAQTGAAETSAKRIAGLSSFGISGTNAHIVLEEGPDLAAQADTQTVPVHLLTLSAKSAAALQAYAQRYSAFLASATDQPLRDLCYTSHVARSHFTHRLAVTAASVTELQQKLISYVKNGADSALPTGFSAGVTAPHKRPPQIAFLFTGQGAQYVAMGRELYETQPIFRAALSQCDELLREHLGESLLAVMFGETGDRGSATSLQSPVPGRIDDTTYTQPALFALEYALATLWQAWGVQPSLLIGHSVGEVAAACVAGIFSLADGIKLIAARGRLMGALPQDGAMVSLLADEARVRAALQPYRNEVAIAAINGPTSVVISGKRTDVLAITEQLAATGVKSRQLAVSHAFHSPLMDPMLAEFRRVAQSITYRQPTLRLVSNVTGKLAGPEIATPEYWVRHVREAVRFVDGVATLYEQNIEIFLEIGPKPTLIGMAQEIYNLRFTIYEKEPSNETALVNPKAKIVNPVLLASLRQQQSDWQQMLTALGELYVRGVKLDWQDIHKDEQHRKVPLPTYPFQRQRYWLPSSPTARVNGQNDVTEWLSAQSVAGLTELVMGRGMFATEERAMVAKVLRTLEGATQSQQRTAQIEAMLYAVTWEKQPNTITVMPPPTPGRWLILADAQGVGAAVATQLRALGEQVDCLPADSATLTSYFASEQTDALPLRGVIQLASFADRTVESVADLQKLQEKNLGSLLQLVQALATQRNSAELPRLWVVTQGAQSVVGTETVAVAQTPLWGLGRVIALEHEELWGGLIDTDSAAVESAAADLAAMAELLLAEVLQPYLPGAKPWETQVAYRNGARYSARLVRGHLPAAPQTEPVLALHADALYLVTGGLGALGLLVAEWLAEHGVKQLVLTGRHGVTKTAQQAVIDRLTAKGVNVQVAPVDVADEAAMRTLFAQLTESGAPLKGVFHTAGVLDDAILLNQRWDRFATVLAAKVQGSWLLHQLTHGLALDFMVFFSSGVALLGNRGQGNYAAANAFLDGLAHYRRQQGLPALSINWGAWANEGMAARTQKIALAEHQVIAPAVGLAALAHLLGAQAAGELGSSQIGVMPIDWTLLGAVDHLSQPFFANFVTPAAPTSAKQQATDRGPLRQELEKLAANRRLAHLREHLQQAVRTILGMSDLPDRTTGFADLGMDSLMALELRRYLEHALACSLPTTVAFEYPTIDELATYLLEGWETNDQQPTTNLQLPITNDQSPITNLNEPIAVISMACRFPGADTPEAFWALLQAGKDMVQVVPAARWDVDEFYDPQRPVPGKMYMREGAFVDDVELFDPLFFGIAPREAVGMDPQHRLLLEVSWEALERAGLVQQRLVDSQTGVFVGIGPGDYGALSGITSLAELDTHTATSAGHSIAAGRLAYTLGLQGPAIAVDTACSSSLVSLHLACQSLRAGECDLALAGGVSLMLSPFGHITLSQMQALAPDGRCKTFDAAADGYGRGEGCGMVVLKRLSEAERDGDTVLAVIRGSAVNHNGPSSGLTVPNKRAQEKLLRQALNTAQVTPAEVSYVEAHGTGTPLGDPIELRALGAVFGEQRATPLLVGSVKTNVGHLEAAAGIVGFMKTVLALYHRELPAHLHFQTPNPSIEWEALRLQVPTALQPWPQLADGAPALAGVSSFGISGTNAHLILAAGPEDSETESSETEASKTEDRGQNIGGQERPLHLLTLSAKSAATLPALAERYRQQLQAQPTLDLGDLCYTAAVTRNQFNHRLAIIAATPAELQAQLLAAQQGAESATLLRGTVGQNSPRLAFLFTGQGSQYVEMGRDLYETQPTFRAALDRCGGLFEAYTGESLLAVLYPADSGQAPLASSLDDTTYTQPALFALEYALATLWQTWGVQPDILMGHSVGEVAAACVAGVFSLADGMKLIVARGRLMGALPQDGTMVSLTADEQRVQQAIAPYAQAVAIAAVNGPHSVVISGQRETVLKVAEQLGAEGIKSRPLTVSHAFHSPQMEPMLDDFRQVAESITYHPPQLPLVSNVTGQLAGAEVTTPAYWVRHVREAVRFADGVATLHEQGIDIFLEIGPKPTLLGLAQEIFDLRFTNYEIANADETTLVNPKSKIVNPLMLPSLRPNQPDWQSMLRSLGELYVRGVDIAWTGFEQGYTRHKMLLPTYPFQRQRYWLEAKPLPLNGTEPQGGFANWLSTHNIEALTDLVFARMTDQDGSTTTERAVVTKVLALLAAEGRTQQLAAQLETMLYEIAWERQQKALPIIPPPTAGRWLVLAAYEGLAGELGAALTTQLTTLGETVELLTSEAELAEYTNLVARSEHAAPLRGILHLWALNNSQPNALVAEPIEDALARLMQSQEQNLGSVVQLIQALATRQVTNNGVPPRLWIVTQGAQQLAPAETVAVAQTALWGLGRVVALEHGDFWGGLIDLAPDQGPAIDSSAVAQILLAEVLQPTPDGETQVAYRQGQRHVARLVRGKLKKQRTPQIQADARYLITGGLGALGLVVAEWLAEQGATQLVLTSRSGITSDAQQAAVDQLTAQGVTVEIAQVDVADGAAMRSLFARMTGAALPLKGVFHTAGVLDDGILLNQSWARFAKVLAAKVTGSWLLHQLTQGLALDFMVFFSSATALLGNMGQANYAAANAFLDGLARYRQQQGLPGLSINWGAWAAGGMAARTSQMRLAEGQIITPQLGQLALAQLLGATGQIGVMPIDWQAFATVGKPPPFLANFVSAPTGETLVESTAAKPTLVQELEALPVARRLEHLNRYLLTTVGQVLGIADFTDRTTGFADLGMDSLLALELRQHLVRGLNRSLPTTIAFEYPTVDALAGYLLDYLAIRDQKPETRANVTNHQSPITNLNEPIAVISMACRFPGADTPEAFWQLLLAGEDRVQEIPATRWKVDEFYDPHRPTLGKMYMRAAAFLDTVDGFDPLFFGISPREAVGVDPQHRLLLETSWEALERAGLAPSSLVESQTGVFVGIGAGDYGFMTGVQSLTDLDSHMATGGGHSVAAGRLAYTLGLQGPTLAVDTACSSSLVSLHLACQSLRNGECDLALAGGVNLMLAPFTHIALSQMGALSADGRCKTFDAAADGYGRGEGCGMVLLKRLSDAEAAGDPILAVIKGSAVNHDGPSSGLTVPNKRAQEKLIRQALAAAQVTPDEVSYVEAHGTGTALGDPIELRALGAVFGATRATPLLVGSVKTNVGHLEAAAGIAGFMKTVLALQHRQIPPHLHFHTPNPYIEWDELAITVPTTPQAWPQLETAAATPALAGVSSFGISGTNAHIVVAAAPEGAKRTGGQRPEARGQDIVDQERPLHLLTLSAKHTNALTALAQRYLAHLQAHPELDLGDLCYTAAVGRNHFSQRVALVAANQPELQAKLAQAIQGERVPGLLRGDAHTGAQTIAFLFTGQGSQYLAMGRDLYETQPTFRAALDRCEGLFQAYTGESLLAVLYPETSHRPSLEGTSSVISYQLSVSSHIDDTTYTQPALFALEYALATLWQTWGVQPDILIGHSVGEVAAACVAGVFSLADGMKLIAARGRLMGALPQDGTMVSLLADEQRVQQAIAPYAQAVAIAAVNGPHSVVISGQREAVEKVVKQLAAEGIKSRPLTVSHAFHSPLMEPMLDDFRQVAESITYHMPQLPLVSNVTGQLAGAEVATPAYWVRHVREAVRFADGVATLHEQGIDIFLEIGPKPTLIGMAQEIDELRITNYETANADETTRVNRQSKIVNPLMLPSLRPTQPDWQRMLESLGELYVRGVAIDWAGFDRDYTRHKLLLPTYSFQRQRYWVEMPKAPQRLNQPVGLRPLIDKMTQSPLIRETIFETVMSVDTLPFLADHRVYDRVVAPGACHLAMVLSAAELALRPQLSAQPPIYQLSDVIFPQALMLADDETRVAQIIFTPPSAHENRTNGASYQRTKAPATFQLITLAGATGTADSTPSIHASGTVAVTSGGMDDVANAAGAKSSLLALQARYVVPHTLAEEANTLESSATESALRFGPTFRWLDEVWRLPIEDQSTSSQPLGVLAKLRRPAAIPSLAGYLLHPGLLDACFQAVGIAYQLGQAVDELMLPFAIEAMQFYEAAVEKAVGSAATDTVWWCHVQQADATKWNILLFDETGQRLAQIDKFELRAAPQTALQSARVRTDWLYTLDWTATPLPEQQATAQLPDCWLLVGTLAGAGEPLTQHLAATCKPVFTAPPPFSDDETLRQRLAELAALHHSVGVVYGGIPHAALAELTIAEQAHQLCHALLQLTQALLTSEMAVHLWVVTQGCQVVNNERGAALAPATEQPLLNAAMGALWGLGRTLAQEQPQLHCVCLDLATGAADQQAALLYQELQAGLGAMSSDGQVAYRQRTRYVAHLVPWQAPAGSDPAGADEVGPVRLQLKAYGSLENLAFVPLARRKPAAGEIEVAVKAVGLNFRDVLNALGMLKEYYATVLGIAEARALGLGFECAGVVSAVGEGVTAFAVGDRVMGLATIEGAFASYLTLPATQMTAIPEHLTDEQAATLPMTFLTAWYGLVELARLQPGERILIHAAAGGVGQAAVQIAQLLGAEVIATASPSKWDALHQQGVAHVLNSRTLDFAAEVLQITDGAGVDVVLNSLNGDFIERSFAILGRQGRFVEIGKLGIWSYEQVAQVRPDAAYYPFDLGEAMLHDPTLQARLWQAITAQLRAGTLQPLPYTRFTRQETVAAFRYMQQAKQIGKIVVNFAAPTPVVQVDQTTSQNTIKPDASYLITGGLGALGLHIAQQLVADGARQLVLTGRQGVTTAAQQAIVDALTAAGATITVVQTDMANRAAVQTLIARCTEIAPLCGIVHTAGVLDDGVLTAQTAARFTKVMQPKVDGAWHLHTITQEMGLDFFVCFSSVASLLGSPGQSNYAAANAFMDTLMQQRQQRGLPGLSINWGPWAGSDGLRGMAAGLQERMQAQGLTMIAPHQGRLLFRYLLNQPVAQIGVLPLQRQEPASQPAAEPLNWMQQLADVAENARPARLMAYLRTEIVTVLGLRDETPLDPRTRLFDFGLDSLMAVELKNRLEAGLGCALRSTLLFDYPTLEALTDHLLRTVLKFAAEPSDKPVASQPAPPTNNGSSSTSPIDDVDAPPISLQELSVDDLIAFIAKEDQEFS